MQDQNEKLRRDTSQSSVTPMDTLQSSAEGQADVTATQLSPHVSGCLSQFSYPENGGDDNHDNTGHKDLTFGPQLSLGDMWHSKDRVPGHKMEAQDTEKMTLRPGRWLSG